MESPFKFFRTHQKQMLVFLFLAAMLAFIVGDPLMKALSYYRGEGGGAAQALVETNAGGLTAADLERLQSRRGLANRFIFQAAQAVGQRNSNLGFGNDSQAEVVYVWLMRKEAERLGATVENSDVDNFLDRTFQNKLTTDKFQDVCDEMRLSPFSIYSILKEELLALKARQISQPLITTSPDQFWQIYQKVHTRQKIEAAAIPVSAFTAAVDNPSDREVEEFFEKHKATLDGRYRRNLPQNGQYKPGFLQPRKVQLQYLKLSYERAEAAVAKSKPITDDEVQKYYDEKKGVDLTLQEPPEVEESTTRPRPRLNPGDEDEAVTAPADDATDEAPEQPENKADPETKEPGTADTVPSAPETKSAPVEPGQPDAADPKTELEKTEPAKPAAGESGAGKPAQEVTAEKPSSAAPPTEPALPEEAEVRPEAPSEPDACGPQGPASPEAGAIEVEQPAAKAEAKAEPESELPALPEPVAEAAEPNPAEEGEGGTESPAAGESDESMGIEDDDSAPAAPPEPTKTRPGVIRYKPLDDELKQVIRERLLRQRTKVYLKRTGEKIADQMFDAGQSLAKFVDPQEMAKATPQQRRQKEEKLHLESVGEAEEILKKIGASVGAEYGATGLLSGIDLLEDPVLGKTQEFIPDENSRNQPESLPMLSFKGQALYAAMVVEGLGDGAAFSDDRFIVWKVRDVQDHVPALTDPGVREEVIAAWKRVQAIPKARERAEALAQQARKGATLEAGLAGATVTGEADSGELVVRESPEFSWYRQSSSFNPFSMEPVELGSPVIIDAVGEKFMEEVFDAMGPNDVKVVANDDASIQYIVRVSQRRPASREAFKSAQLYGASFQGMSLPSQYQKIANEEVRRSMLQHERDLERRYAVRVRNQRTGELQEPSSEVEEVEE